MNDDIPNASDQSHQSPDVVEAELLNDVVEAELVSEADGPRNRLSATGWISWLVVLAITAGIIAFVATDQRDLSKQVGGDATSADLMQIELLGKMLVGQREAQKLTGEEPPPDTPETIKTIRDSLTEMNTGTYEQQLAHCVLVNELLGGEEAETALQDLTDRTEEHEFKPSDSQAQLREAITTMIDANQREQFDETTFSAKQQTLLSDRLGWIGRLATVPAETPEVDRRKTVLADALSATVVYLIAFLLGALALLTGFVLLGIAIRKTWTGKITGRFKNRFGTHNVYIETFALWILYFFGVQILVGPYMESLPIDALLFNVIFFFSSLLALGWPVLRGISFSQVMADIGLESRRPVREVIIAPLGYLATIPLVFLSAVLLVTLLVSTMQSEETPPFSRGNQISHPIQNEISQGGAMGLILVVIAACIAAPIVEEIMFRGVLYRHLRDVTAHWRRAISVTFSAIFNAFIFAAIHPQGIMLIPVLGALAVGFSLVREWRGSLWPCMTMHAIHNSLVTCLMVQFL